jgi:hypothetical protein
MFTATTTATTTAMPIKLDITRYNEKYRRTLKALKIGTIYN